MKKEKIVLVPYTLNEKSILNDVVLDDGNIICVDFDDNKYRNIYDNIEDFLKLNFKNLKNIKDNMKFYGNLELGGVIYYNFYINVTDIKINKYDVVKINDLVKSSNPFILSIILKYFVINYKNLFI